MLLWVGSQASPDFVRDVFGVSSPQQIDPQVCELPALDTPSSAAVRALVHDTRVKRRTAMRVSARTEKTRFSFCSTVSYSTFIFFRFCYLSIVQ